jgi:ribosomal protein S18 acetylase RimI-like enzyme
MQKVKIRRAVKGDFETIQDLIFEWLKWEIERTKAFFGVLSDENHVVLVAEVNGKVVGFLHLLFYTDILHGGINSHVLLVFVKEEYRRKHIGKKLLDEAVKQAIKRGAIEMHVDTTFEEAAKFYRQYGFKDDGVMLELQLKT